MPKQSFFPSPLGVNAFGNTNLGTPLLSTFTVTEAEELQPAWVYPVAVKVVVVSSDATGFRDVASSR